MVTRICLHFVEKWYLLLETIKVFLFKPTYCKLIMLSKKAIPCPNVGCYDQSNSAMDVSSSHVNRDLPLSY